MYVHGFSRARLGERGEEKGAHRDRRSGDKETKNYLRSRVLRFVRHFRRDDGRHIEIQYNGSGRGADIENSIFGVDGEYPFGVTVVCTIFEIPNGPNRTVKWNVWNSTR